MLVSSIPVVATTAGDLIVGYDTEAEAARMLFSEGEHLDTFFFSLLTFLTMNMYSCHAACMGISGLLSVELLFTWMVGPIVMISATPIASATCQS